MKKIPLSILLIFTLLTIVIVSNRIVILQTDSQIYVSPDKIPNKDIALVLGARKDGLYGPNPYFKSHGSSYHIV